jgi:hypothetical protein
MPDDIDELDPEVLERSRRFVPEERRRGPYPSPGEIAGGDPGLHGARPVSRGGSGAEGRRDAGTESERTAEKEGDDNNTVVSLEKLSLFPRIGDPYVKAHATPARGSLPMVVLLCRDGSRPTFSYGDLRFIDVLPPGRPGESPRLLLRFFGVGKAEIEGIDVERLHGYLYLHRIAWIREVPEGRTVRGDPAVVVTRITVTLLKE